MRNVRHVAATGGFHRLGPDKMCPERGLSGRAAARLSVLSWAMDEPRGSELFVEPTELLRRAAAGENTSGLTLRCAVVKCWRHNGGLRIVLRDTDYRTARAVEVDATKPAARVERGHANRVAWRARRVRAAMGRSAERAARVEGPICATSWSKGARTPGSRGLRRPSARRRTSRRASRGASGRGTRALSAQPRQLIVQPHPHHPGF